MCLWFNPCNYVAYASESAGHTFMSCFCSKHISWTSTIWNIKIAWNSKESDNQYNKYVDTVSKPKL